MQAHYSTVAQDEIRPGVAQVIDLAGSRHAMEALDEALCANVRETVAPFEFSVEPSRAKIGVTNGKCDVVEGREARYRGDSEGKAAEILRRVQAQDSAGGCSVRGAWRARRSAAARGPVLVSPEQTERAGGARGNLPILLALPGTTSLMVARVKRATRLPFGCNTTPMGRPRSA